MKKAGPEKHQQEDYRHLQSGEGGQSLKPPDFALTANPIQQQAEDDTVSEEEKQVLDLLMRYPKFKGEFEKVLPFSKESVRGVSFATFIKNTKFQMDMVNEVGLSPIGFLEEIWPNFKAMDAEAMQKDYSNWELEPKGVFPPNCGAWDLQEVKSPSPNEEFDRFQHSWPSLGGSFCSPMDVDGEEFSLESRALRENAEEMVDSGKRYFYLKFRVLDASGLSFEMGKCIPWFGKEGGALQASTNVPLHTLSNDQFEVTETKEFINKGGTYQWIQYHS